MQKPTEQREIGGPTVESRGPGCSSVFSEKWLPGALGPELREALVIERAPRNGLTAKEQLVYDTSKEILEFQGQGTSAEGSLNQRRSPF